MLQIAKGIEISAEMIQKYSTFLPDDIIEIWKEYGYGSLLGGYLRVINPEEYQELLRESYFRGNVSIPIFSTAFGDILTLEEGEYIGMIMYKYGDSRLITKKKRFIQNLEDDCFVGKYFQIPLYTEAVSLIGELKPDECFGYVPLLGLGGKETVENLSKVKMREHIELITQLVGKIEM